MGLNNWTEYTGSYEQLAELENSENGYIIKIEGSEDVTNVYKHDNHYCDITHYWIIPDDPLREMKIRHAMTGQPVWVRKLFKCGIEKEWQMFVTTKPDWCIPSAEYSFKPF